MYLLDWCKHICISIYRSPFNLLHLNTKFLSVAGFDPATYTTSQIAVLPPYQSLGWGWGVGVGQLESSLLIQANYKSAVFHDADTLKIGVKETRMLVIYNRTVVYRNVYFHRDPNLNSVIKVDCY